jgi:hypothetical protein
MWRRCQENNLSLNINKTKEVDRKLQETAEGAPRYPHRWDRSGEGESFKFLSVHITDTLKWTSHTDSVVKKSTSSPSKG